MASVRLDGRVHVNVAFTFTKKARFGGLCRLPFEQPAFGLRQCHLNAEHHYHVTRLKTCRPGRFQRLGVLTPDRGDLDAEIAERKVAQNLGDRISTFRQRD